MSPNYPPSTAPAPAPGDILAFSGRGPLNALINLATLGVPRFGFSHVGIITADIDHGLALVESTSLPSDPCLVQLHHAIGPQFQPIGPRVEGYAGRVYHFALARPLRPNACPHCRNEVNDLANYLRGIVSDGIPYDYIGAARSRTTIYARLRSRWFGAEDLTRLFCSELVALALRHVDRFGTDNASKWNPNSLIRAARRRRVVRRPTRWK